MYMHSDDGQIIRQRWAAAVDCKNRIAILFMSGFQFFLSLFKQRSWVLIMSSKRFPYSCDTIPRQMLSYGLIGYDLCSQVTTATPRNAWQSLSCSPPGIAVSPLSELPDYWSPQCLAVPPLENVAELTPVKWLTGSLNSILLTFYTL